MAEQKQPVVYIPDNGRKKSSQKKNKKIANTIIYIVLGLMTIIWLTPFVFLVLESLRESPNTATGNPFFAVEGVDPFVWGFGNYVKLFAETEFPKWFLNTFIIAICTAALQTIIVLCMSYTLSRSRFAGRKLLMNFMLVIGMFPGFLTLLVLYTLLKAINLTGDNAVGGLILVYCASSGMGYHVSKGFFDTVPKALDEAARIDGANRAQVLYKIILPMAKPIVIYTILTAFMGPWGDFVLASYVAFNSVAGKNVAVGLQSWLDITMSDHYTLFCTGGVVVAIPVTLLFIFLQKYYVEGVTGGAVKG
jgi:arabinogalactan oligomer/maltooligosaccharide transport system permease protein